MPLFEGRKDEEMFDASRLSQVYPYTKPSVDMHAPRCGGVYVLTERRDERNVVFYVGQAQDLRERLSEHLLRSEENACIRQCLRSNGCGFCFAKISDQTQRQAAEKWLILHFQPRCNSQNK